MESSSEVDVAKKDLASLIDFETLQSLVDALYAVTNIGFAIMDLKGNVLASAGWSEICKKFHRVNPQSLWNCLENDLELTRNVTRGEFRAHKCKNNMWDIVTPLVIGNRHVGNVFSGQFFFEDEIVDRELFVKQAEKFGFDKANYLAALDKVPRWNKETVKTLMQFYVKLTEMISTVSYSNLNLSKSLSHQRHIESELRKSQHDLNHAQEVAATGSWRLNVQTNELLWSDETYRIFGIPKGVPMTYETFLECVYPEDRGFVDEAWKSALRGSKYDIKHRILVGNRVSWVHEKAELEFDKDGVLVGGFGTLQDITERKSSEEKLLRLNRALRAISNSNQALARSTDEMAFLRQGCRIIVEDCGYKLVWVGFAEDDAEKTVKPVVYAGFDKGYIDSLKITWADAERGRGPCGSAIRTGKAQICRNMRIDPDFAPWRKEALERGYASSIVLPLTSNGKAFGVLNIYSKYVNPFSEDEVKLLDELASDLAQGIMLLRMRAAKEQAEEALVNANALYKVALEASNLGAWDYHLDTGEVFWDERTRDMFGVSSGAVIKYSDAIERIHPDDRLDTDEAVREAIAGINNGEFNREFRVVWSNGGMHWLLSHGKVHFSGEGSERRAVRFIGVTMDITERKEAERALSKAREEWERTFDSLPDLVAIVDYKNRLLRINKAMAKRLGVKPEQCFGKKCHEFMHGTQLPPEFCPHLKTLKDGQEHIAQIHEAKLCGDFMISTAPLRDEQGKIIGSVHIAHEIAKDKKN